MGVVVPNPALSVWRGSEHAAARLQNSTDLLNYGNGVVDVLEQILEDSGIERAVFERKSFIDIGVHDGSPAFRGGCDGLCRGVHARVAGEVVREPAAAGPEIEDLGVGLEVACDVPVVAGLLMPRDVAHAAPA